MFPKTMPQLMPKAKPVILPKPDDEDFDLELVGTVDLNESIEVNASLGDLVWEEERFDIEVYVTDQITGDPIEGALVSISGDQDETDEYGYVLIDKLEGEYSLSIEKDGYGGYFETIEVDDDDVINADLIPDCILSDDVVPDDLAVGDIDWEDREFTVTFNVKDFVSGDPIEGATVTFRGETELTGATGIVAFTLGIPGGDQFVTVTHDDYPDLVDFNLGEIDDDETFDIELLGTQEYDDQVEIDSVTVDGLLWIEV